MVNSEEEIEIRIESLKIEIENKANKVENQFMKKLKFRLLDIGKTLNTQITDRKSLECRIKKVHEFEKYLKKVKLIYPKILKKQFIGHIVRSILKL